MSFLEIIRIIFGIIYICFLPGFALVHAIFEKGKLDFISIFTLSIVFSLGSVTTLVYFLNFVGVKINTVNILWETVLIIFIGATISFVKYKKINHEQ